MGNRRNSKKHANTPSNDISEAEAPKTELAVAKATEEIADVMSPENIVVDEPPPQPDYPHYRVQPGKPIVLADLIQTIAKTTKKRSTLKRNFKSNAIAWVNYKNVCMQKTNAAC